MTGTIALLNRRTSSGAIQSADGPCFDFDLTAVLAYDAALLVVGKPVHFDVGCGASPKAMNISIDAQCGIPTGKDKDREINRLRYIGFEHRGNVRSFRFERISPREAPQTFSIDADMMLFSRYQVRIQDGPALCLQLLSVGLETARDPHSFVPSCLNGQHMTSFLANQPVRGTRHGLKNAAGLSLSRSPASGGAERSRRAGAAGAHSGDTIGVTPSL